VAINPFSSDNVDAWRLRHQSPGVISLEGVELRLHGGTPVRVSEGRPERCWKWREGRRTEVEAVHRLNEAGFTTGMHAMLIGDGRNGLRGGGSTVPGTAGSNLRGRGSGTG
jgi:hypothetical protein